MQVHFQRTKRIGATGDSALFVLLVLIVLSGALLRLHDIGGESVDLEEYACVGGVEAPNWNVFFEEQRSRYPYGAPLAPALIYLWARLAGTSIAAIRMLFACISIVNILLCYRLALAVFRFMEPLQRRRAGLVAALCFALSPLHVFHAQEARMYALVSLFTLLAMMSLAEGIHGGKRGWWILNVFANAGLLASHYFTVFLLPVQGLVLLLQERRLSRRLICWSLVQGVLLAGLMLWVARIPRQAEDLYSYYSAPSLTMVVQHLLARDSTTLSASAFFPSSRAWNWLPGTAGASVRGAHRYVDAALIAASLCAFLAAAACAALQWRRGNLRLSFTWILLLLWALLPAVLMVAVSWLWRPIYGSRYVMYSSFALYLMFGAFASGLRGRAAYRAVLMGVVALFGYQLSLAFPTETRTAWRHALEKIQAQSGGDSVLLLEDPFWLPVLRWNEDRQNPVPVAAAFQRSTLYEAASFLNAFGEKAGQVWVLLVLTTDFDETPFVRGLLERSLSYDRYYYPGERKLALYRLHRNPVSGRGVQESTAAENLLFGPMLPFLKPEQTLEAGKAFLDNIRYLSDESGGFWLRLGAALAAHGRGEAADAVFRRAIGEYGSAAYELLTFARECPVDLDDAGVMKSILGNTSNDTDKCARLRTVLHYAAYEMDSAFLESLGLAAVEVAPHCAESYLFLGFAMHRREAHAEAVPYFQKAFALNPKVSPESAEAYGTSLADTGASEAAIQVFKEAAEVWPEFNWLYMRLGIVYADMGRHAEAVEAYRRALAPLQDDFYITYLLLQSLLALQRYEEALPFARLQVLVGRREIWVQLVRWRAFVGAGRHDEAEEALKLLAAIAPDFEELYDILYRHSDRDKANALLEAARKDNDPLVNELALAVAHLEGHKP